MTLNDKELISVVYFQSLICDVIINSEYLINNINQANNGKKTHLTLLPEESSHIYVYSTVIQDRLFYSSFTETHDVKVYNILYIVSKYLQALAALIRLEPDNNIVIFCDNIKNQVVSVCVCV